MADKQKILIVDDDKNIAELLSLFLKRECFSVQMAYDGEEALSIFSKWNPDLILLDLMLPGIDGYEVIRRIRTSSLVPVIILSAKGDVFDKVLCLELGADDYLIKPFDRKELLARVKAVLRRTRSKSTEKDTKKELLFPGLTISLNNYTVIVGDKKVEMPPKELELLYFLASSPNKVFTRDQLLDHIWGFDYIGDSRTVDVHIKRIREKISESVHWELSTVWSVGYKFEVK